MADSIQVTAIASRQPLPPAAEEDGGGRDEDEGGGLTDAQKELLERCLHALKHAKNDSHSLAALLLITRLCPASQLDKPTLRRIFEAVGFNLPARLLVTAVKGSENSSLNSEELLSLGTALLAALSTDPEMASHPHLLTTIPLLLGILGSGPQASQQRDDAGEETQAAEDSGGEAETVPRGETEMSERDADGDDSAANEAPTPQESSPRPTLDEAIAADCYQVLTAVCALPQGPEQLLSRGAVPGLCHALELEQTYSRAKGLDLLGRILQGKSRERAWGKHPAELHALLLRLLDDFSRASGQASLDQCARLPRFLPPPGAAEASEELKAAVSRAWAALRPMVQAKLTPKQICPVLVLSACLLDLYGWGAAGPPKFCCLLVNRACVEVRMGLEEPPGSDMSPEQQHTLTGCYRIMEAAIEQACSVGIAQSAPPPQGCPAAATLSTQQSRQVLGVLEEAYQAIIYYLQQVHPSRYGDPFVFATFRALCSWLAEETSCLKEEVSGLLPFLVGYSRSHLRDESPDGGLARWMADMSVGQGGETWTGTEALRYLLPALCHLTAEEAPRKVLLDLNAPALLVDFLSRCWSSMKGKGGGASARDPSMETACSALLNITVTEAERVRTDPCFRSLETLLGDTLPVLVHKPHLLVLTANYCTLGLMIGRLQPAPTGQADAGQRRFFSAALRFLRGALDSGSGCGPVQPAPGWAEGWDEAAELWRLGLQALGGCVRAHPWLAGLAAEEGWLQHTLAVLGRCQALPDQHTQGALEEALCAVAEQSPACRRDIGETMARSEKSVLSSMSSLKKLVREK